MLIVLVPNIPAAAPLILVNGTAVTGYVPLEDTDWGFPTWEHVFTSPRSAHGPRVARGVVQAREVHLSLRAYGTSKDDLAAKLVAVATTVDQMRRVGGTIIYQANGQTYRQYLRVLTATMGPPEYGRAFENRYDTKFAIGASCAPYADGDAMEFYDGFDQDTIAAALWTYDAGVAGNLGISAGTLNGLTNLTTYNQLIAGHTGYAYGDVECRADSWWPGVTNTNQRVGVILKRLDASNYIRAYLDDNGTNTRLMLEYVNAGVATGASAVNLASRLGTGSTFQLVTVVGRIEGAVLYAEAWTTKRWTPAGTPDYSSTLLLPVAGGVMDKFGETVQGGVGVYFRAQATTAWVDNFACEPYVYRRWALPNSHTIRLAGPIPGDAPARMDVEVATPSSVNNYIPWGVLAWTPRPRAWNHVWNGGGEGSATVGWSIANITGFQFGCTSLSVNTSAALAKFGSSFYQFVTPGTNANEGPTFRLFRRYKAGQRYTATVWVRQNAGVAAALLLNIGAASADRVTASSGTLTVGSTTYTQITVTWTPTQNEDTVYVGICTAGTNAGTFHFDGMAVFEGPSIPAVPATLQPHLEGLGAPPSFGLHTAPSILINTPAKFTLSTSVGMFGYCMFYTVASGAAASNDTMIFIVDPNLLVGDDYMGAGIEARGVRQLISGGAYLGQAGAEQGLGEVDVEVYARMGVPGGTTPNFMVTQVLTYMTSGNSVRYSKEYGNAVKTLQAGLNAAYTWKRVRLGTYTLTVAPDGARWAFVMGVFWNANATGQAQSILLDTLEFVPVRRRAASPSAKHIDATYPYFMNNTSSAEQSKLIRSDLSVEASYPPSAQRFPDHGPMGSLIEPPPGLTDCYLALDTFAPDDPSQGSDDNPIQTTSVRFSPRPRYAMLRPISG